MMKFFRKHRNTLMIIIAVLAIPFVFYFVQRPDYARMHSDDFAQIYGRKVSMVEAQRYARLLGIATRLGMTDFIQDLTFGAQDQNQQAFAFIVNLLILRREAERLGIDATAQEQADFVRSLRVFNGPNGAFDVGKYTEFVQEFLAPNGFSDAQVEELARDDIALRRIKELVAAGVSVPETEAKDRYQQAYGRLSASVIRLHNADFAKDIKLSDDDIKKYYDAHKAELKSEEKRKIEFVAFNLGNDQKKLTGKERVDALQKLQTRATDFTQALQAKGASFEQAAAKFQLPVQTTDEFTSNKPDPKLGANGGQLAAAAFQLTPEEPNSELIEVPDGYAVLHLAGLTPAKQLTLDEAKPKITESLTTTHARQAMSLKAAQVIHDLREGLKTGEPLSFAAEKVNVKAEKIPAFTLMDDENELPDPAKAKEKRDLMMLKNAVATLQPGDVSELFPSEDGGIIAVLETRDPPDETKYGPKKADLAKRITDNKRDIAFYEWLRQHQQDAGLLKREAGKGQPG
jgi:peptidyl-prolyl cis-trans isomerase D